ncbi:hypothetical protein [Alkalibacillus salilacus]|uniref:Uncharacterized protein n=1 Tax=Alkalibacillus salilacus TaxID=284582 RepID=A0ABT9VDC6_9BACI|nr:hypothetical protein [Alkalibacillus salilacus]MDQ0158979.1 hypothetical protein [Alkalibacillus salilacus]
MIEAKKVDSTSISNVKLDINYSDNISVLSFSMLLLRLHLGYRKLSSIRNRRRPSEDLKIRSISKGSIIIDMLGDFVTIVEFFELIADNPKGEWKPHPYPFILARSSDKNRKSYAGRRNTRKKAIEKEINDVEKIANRKDVEEVKLHVEYEDGYKKSIEVKKKEDK